MFARYNSWNLSFEVSTEFSNVSMLEIALGLSVLFSWICIIIFSILICGHTDGDSYLHYAALDPSKTEHAEVQVIKVAGAIMERGVIELISQADLHSGLTPLDCAVYVGNDALARMLAEGLGSGDASAASELLPSGGSLIREHKFRAHDLFRLPRSW